MASNRFTYRNLKEESNKNLSSTVFAPIAVDYHSSPNLMFNKNCLLNINVHVFRRLISLHISYSLDT